MIVVEVQKSKIRTEDWACTDPLCGNVNYQWRKFCNICHKSREEHVPPLVKVIGQSAAEKSEGVFKAEDWQCKGCGNVNWARRQECNRCKLSKFDLINMISPDEIFDVEDDRVSVHSALSDPPNEDGHDTVGSDTNDSGVMECSSTQQIKEAEIVKFNNKLAESVLGCSLGDANRRPSLDKEKVSLTLSMIMYMAYMNLRGEADFSEEGLRAMDEDMKNFFLNSDMLTPEQKILMAQTSVSQIYQTFLSMVPEYVMHITNVSVNNVSINMENPPADALAVRYQIPPPPVPQPAGNHSPQCHGTERTSHEGNCSSGSPPALPPAHNCRCGSLSENRCCDTRPVTCCNSHSCDKKSPCAKTQTHSCSSSRERPTCGSSCCHHRQESNAVPQANHNHMHSSNNYVQEERRVPSTATGGDRGPQSHFNPPVEERRVLIVDNRRSPSPPIQRRDHRGSHISPYARPHHRRDERYERRDTAPREHRHDGRYERRDKELFDRDRGYRRHSLDRHHRY